MFHRQELHAVHSQMFESLHQGWLDDVENSREQEDHLAVSVALSLE